MTQASIAEASEISPLFRRSHGANPEKLYESLGLPLPEKIVDFSTNTNVLPWDGEFHIDLRRSLAAYPDDEAAELRSAATGREARSVPGCSPENVLAVNGSNEAVYLIASFLGGKKTAVLQPVYGEYLRALSAYGSSVCGISDIRALPDDAEALFLCNPCNPTGGYIESGELEKIFAGKPRTLFVVDEAYIDFLSFSPETRRSRKLDFLRHRNVVILRSLTKIFHLCGARIGYVLAAGEHITRLKSRQPTWSVNAPAQAAALAFLKDDGFVRKTREFYALETPRFIAAIENAGFRVTPTRTNFFLVETPDDQKVIRFLLERGLVVRHTRNFPGLDGRYIRIATRTRPENELLAEALKQI